MSTKLSWIEDEIQNLKDNGLYNRIRTLSSPQRAWLVVDGVRVLNFCSNNYLGLANHPRLVQALGQVEVQEFVVPAAGHGLGRARVRGQRHCPVVKAAQHVGSCGGQRGVPHERRAVK